MLFCVIIFKIYGHGHGHGHGQGHGQANLTFDVYLSKLSVRKYDLERWARAKSGLCAIWNIWQKHKQMMIKCLCFYYSFYKQMMIKCLCFYYSFL